MRIWYIRSLDRFTCDRGPVIVSWGCFRTLGLRFSVTCMFLLELGPDTITLVKQRGGFSMEAKGMHSADMVKDYEAAIERSRCAGRACGVGFRA